jgi:hypothetical protein
LVKLWRYPCLISLPKSLFHTFKGRRRLSILRVFGFVDAPFDLADLLGDRNLFGTDFGTLPQGLTTPRPVLVIQESHPFFRAFIP